MTNPIITIIIPIFNAGKYLNDCYNSIIKQGIENIEIIFINDGSTDDTLNICEQIKTSDERVRVFNTANNGVSAARNLGIKNAKGKYLHFIDADDILIEGLYKNSINYLSDADILIFNYITQREHIGKISNKENVIEEKKGRDLLFYLFGEKPYQGFVWNKIIKKEFLKQNIIDFDIKLRFHEDCLFCYKAFLKAKKIIVNSYTGYIHVIRNDSAMMRYWKDNKFDTRYILTLDAFEYMKRNLPNDHKLKISFNTNYIEWCHRIYCEAFTKKYTNRSFYKRIHITIYNLNKEDHKKKANKYIYRIICYPLLYKSYLKIHNLYFSIKQTYIK